MTTTPLLTDVDGPQIMATLVASPDAAPGDTVYKLTLTGAQFTDGTALSGTWTVEYDPSGAIVGITDATFTATGPGGTTTFTFPYPLPYANPAAGGVYEMTFPVATGGAYNSLYVDWQGENPTTLSVGNNSLYTSIKDGASSALTLADSGSVHCFLEGTMIATPAGPVPVESILPGDLVTLARGGSAAVKEIGRKTFAPRFGDPLRILPIRIMAGAFGGGLPQRDLLLSPCHAVLLEGLLVQAGALVNGTTIVREHGLEAPFTYYHLQLAAHELILAEGVAAESFVDNGESLALDSRAALHPVDDTAPAVEMDYPRAKSWRQVPAALHARLASADQSSDIAA